MKVIDLYAVKNKDESVRAKSRSGGTFTALSDYVLNKHGVVYGCILDNDLNVIHSRATTWQQRDLMRGSKYVQSAIGDSFQKAKDDLENDKYVLFSGTSCQIAGFLGYLGDKTYDKLICVDIVCHGVPSNLIWQNYKKWIENKEKEKVISVNFRNKNKFGWKAHVESLTLQNGKNIDSEVFKNLFLSENILRPACYQCPYKSIDHPGDITLADYWGIDKAVPGFNDNKGVSLVLVNSEKGQKLFDDIKENLIYKKTKLEDSLQPALIKPFSKPKERVEFWDDFKNYNFDYIARKYGKYSSIHEKLCHIKRLIKVVIK